MAKVYTDAENREVASLIRDLRSLRGLTQHELCVQAGVSIYTINKLETSTSHVRPATMKVIIEALGRFERVPRSVVERIAAIYGFSPSVIDRSAISEGDGFQAIGRVTAKELHMLLDRALATAGSLPESAQHASLSTLEAVLSAIAGDTKPRQTLIKRYPPERVGDYEVEVVEPATPHTPKKKSG